MSSSDDESSKSPDVVNSIVTAPAVPSSPSSNAVVQNTVQNAKALMDIAKSFVFVEISSLVLMFSSIAVLTDPYYEVQSASFKACTGYALSVACISLAACLFIQIGEFVKPGMLQKFEKPISLFLFVWWGVGTGVITFKNPFTVTSNGWFSAWAGFLFTTHWALHIDSAQFTKMERGRQLLVLLLSCASLLMFACIGPIADNYYLGQAAWGLSVAIVTILACVGLIKKYEDLDIRVMKVSSGVFFVLWAAVAGVCTFDGPFRLTGNGYFASWGGLIVSVLSGLHQMSREDDIV